MAAAMLACLYECCSSSCAFKNWSYWVAGTPAVAALFAMCSERGMPANHKAEPAAASSESAAMATHNVVLLAALGGAETVPDAKGAPRDSASASASFTAIVYHY